MVPRLRERLFPSWLWRLPPGSGQIALTFDDGPDSATTPQLLEALVRHSIPATHFVTGNRCETNGSLLRDLHDAGQVIANHGYVHRPLILNSTRAQIASIAATQRAVHAATGRLPAPLFRPPHGLFNPATAQALKATGQRGILWSVMLWDWKPQPEEKLWRRLATELSDGAIIVLHDAHPTTSALLPLLPRLADEIGRRGWHFVTLAASAPHYTCKEP
jgi:peptidoglycan/xylan/chitin deacetylase (PgdA/CDA1 family)